MNHGKLLVIVAVSSFLLAGGIVVSAQSLSGDAPRGNWDTTASTGEIILDGDSYYSVFQGERDITRWRNVDGDDVTGSVLSRSPTEEGLDLESIVDRDQRTGRYESQDGTLTARVREPRISSIDMFNRNGVRISSGATVRGDNNILVRVEWNFVEAEDVSIEIREPDGTRATRVALSRDISAAQADLLPGGFSDSILDRETQGVGSTGYSTAYWLIDPSELSDGTNEIRVEGVEDLDFDDASSTVRLRVGSGTGATLSLEPRTASQGERVRFRLGGAEPREYYAVAVHRSELRDEVDPEDVFRLVGETVRTGVEANHAYAVVRTTGRGGAVGQIETRTLRRGDRSFRLFESADSADGALDRLRDDDRIDRRTLTVERSELAANLAGGTYVPGSSIDVSGTASSGVRSVALYARDRGDWELVPLNGRDTTSVRSDGTWRARNVVLSQEDHGGRIFRLPGTYSIAVVDAADLERPLPTSISSSEFSRLTTSRSSVRTTPPTFVANFDTFAGQVAQDDRVSFSGTATGSNEIVVAFVGDRDVRAYTIRGTRGSFVDRQIDLDGMRRGDVTAFAVSPGRDGEFGDGRATDADGDTVSITTPTEFRDYVRSFDRDGRTRSQKTERIRAASVRAGSDDLLRTSTFRINDARTTIRDIVPGEQPQLAGVVPIESGETVLVRGTTNRNPADTVIDVEITEGPDAAEFDVRTVRSWQGDGLWTASFGTSGVSTGTYTVEVDDGRSSDTMAFTVVDDRDAAVDELETLRERLNELRDETESLRGQSEDFREQIEELEEERDRLQQELEEIENESVEEPPAEEPTGTTTLSLIFRIAVTLLVVFGVGALLAAALVFLYRRR